VVVQRPDGGRVEWQITRTFDQAHICRQLLHEKAVTNAATGRHVKDGVVAAAALENSLFDHTVQRRSVADMARPDFVEHAIATFADAQSLRFLKVEVVGAFKKRRRLAKPT
jgi:hypothetical protein